MDGLASFANDPILPLHNDDSDGVGSDFGGSMMEGDGEPAHLTSMNGDDDADQERDDELLRGVFEDGAFNETEASEIYPPNHHHSMENQTADDTGRIQSTCTAGGPSRSSSNNNINIKNNYQQQQPSAELQLLKTLQDFNSHNQQLQNGNHHSQLRNDNAMGPSTIEADLAAVVSMYHVQASQNVVPPTNNTQVPPSTTTATSTGNSSLQQQQQQELLANFQQQQQQHQNQQYQSSFQQQQQPPELVQADSQRQQQPQQPQQYQPSVQQPHQQSQNAQTILQHPQPNFQQIQQQPQQHHASLQQQQPQPQQVQSNLQLQQQQQQQQQSNLQQVQQLMHQRQQLQSQGQHQPQTNGATQLPIADSSRSSLQYQHQHDSMSSLSGGGNSVIELSDDERGGRRSSQNPAKKQRVEALGSQRFRSSGMGPAAVSHTVRIQNMPQWMKSASSQASQKAASRPPHAIQVGGTLTGYRQSPTGFRQTPSYNGGRPYAPPVPRFVQHRPRVLEIPNEYVSTWEYPLPSELLRRPQGRRRFELSLVNLKEFTITGLPVGYDGPPSSLAGLRKKIKDLSKEHGKATYERSKDGSDGRWRIPLGAYASFYAYLSSDPMCQVTGIPQDQLKIASLGKARLEKGYPSIKRLISFGVPRGLATALAPFQRGGVDFVVEKDGRALLADEMGLGKTVQGIASMSVYHRDWPILVLTPSSARYHWENEFQQWLGRDSRINNEKQTRVNLGGESDGEEEDDQEEVDESNCMELLDDSQIHVLTSGKDPVLPSSNTKVVICSYGLAPALVAAGKIYPGLFRVAIVDESHMLKNINTKRTKNLVPVLHATHRCILLSGTPALAKPSELWPQLKILSTEQTGWWEDEAVFLEKYVKNSSAVRRAELHAMLTGTVMIRRLKNDILKSLPKKARGKAVVDVSTPDMRKEFHKCMSLLREGKGQLGKLARQHSALGPAIEETPLHEVVESGADDAAKIQFEKAKEEIVKERDWKYSNRMREIDFALASTATTFNDAQREQWKSQAVEALQRELEVWYQERMHELHQELPQPEDDEISRKSVLNRMYSLTGKAKLPLISSMIRKWLSDPTKGKLCVFAHHIFVLDELVRMAGLSNLEGSNSRYIRIDGSTSPKERQAQIKRFQQDPTVRIAILGITAAGVAVTLTAASTVWFTELFWTPALMIQAEDRCHRIGQNSRVNCLYFVATGTLDDLLWKLLEKKFKDLGEFVEGQEKQKIVVHKTYHGTKDLDSMFVIPDGEGSDEDVNFDDESDDEENKEILKLEHDLEGDIALLGKEELTMMKGENDDDDGADEPALQDSKGEPEHVAGGTEEEAILLSDDEADAAPQHSTRQESQDPEKKTTPGAQPDKPQSSEAGAEESGDKTSTETGTRLDTRKPLQSCRGYSTVFEGDEYGIKLFIHEGRAVVGGKLLAGGHEKPEVGDSLVAVNGQRLPFMQNLKQISDFMKSSLRRGPVELTFVEIPALKDFVLRQAEMHRKQYEEMRTKLAKPITTGPEDIIDLLDDD